MLLEISLITIAASLVFYAYFSTTLVNTGRKLPPGPRGLPFIGNTFSMPTNEQWSTYAGWGHTFGDVVQLNIFGKSLVLLNSHKAASDLLIKRGTIYSDRPQLVMAGELCGMERMSPLTKYGPRFNDQRKLMQQGFDLRAVKHYEHIQQREVYAMLSRVHAQPGLFGSHIRRMAGASILDIVYGYRVQSNDDPFVSLLEETMRIGTNVISSIWVVDFFPSLKPLLPWIPGMKTHKLAREWRQIMEDSANLPFQWTKDTMAASETVPLSLVSSWLNMAPGGDEETIKWTANSLYNGEIYIHSWYPYCLTYPAAGDTTNAVVMTFILAAVLNPHVQTKAWAEIDSVVGFDRLPSLKDRPYLRYVECIVNECLRWGTPVPIIPPREIMKDNEYRNWQLPKGSLCIANIWAMLHDATTFPDPENFNPDRFLQDSKLDTLQDPYTYAFGFGRRHSIPVPKSRCPGVHLGSTSIWLAIARSFNLWNSVSAHNI
ncbi:cytochrome P450 [Infundibulicybe gibba]|nr:cytochrome P450 [Infundibulicybe gibba]